MDRPIGPFAFEVLACLPKEPCMAIMSDLVDDLVPEMKDMVGRGKVLSAIHQIRRKYGLFEGKCGKVAGYGVPATAWERTQFDTIRAMEKVITSPG